MAYWQNDPLIAADNADEYIFRAVRECSDLRGEPERKRKRLLTPSLLDRRDTLTSLSGLWCHEWPLGATHACIPDVIKRRAAFVAFKRQEAEISAIRCDNDEVGFINHVAITLPVYKDENDVTTTEFEIKRDELFDLLQLLWTDCEPTVQNL
jgi:hypothetical protein